MSIVFLNRNWAVRSEELDCGPEMASVVLDREDGWINADLPCDIHTPLIENGIIKEPLEADNCLSCEWIEEKSWWFKKVFNLDEKELTGDIIELNLESLDSEADVFLNGFHLGHHKSAFYPFTMDVGKFLKKGENIILVRVSSGLEYYNELDLAGVNKNMFFKKTPYNRGDVRRVFVRKPQYVYGWDWGPRVATCGIMKGVYIESFKKLAVRSVHATTGSIDNDARLGFQIEIENLHPYSTIDGTVKLEIFYGDERVISLEHEELLRSGSNYIHMEASIIDPKLWWPNGMGEQHLYTIKVSVQSGQVNVVYKPFKFGIRTLKIDQEKIADGRRFTFEINGVKAFCKGGNWIPSDSIYARVTDEKYDTLIREAKEANFNMLRIWGGGIYERDIFYEKCDEYGIMIWHDFMFACGIYPDHLEWFQKEVENEMDYQTRRLRNHTSIVLWCGNNENSWGFDEWWPGLNPDQFGGAVCYNKIAPRIIQKNCPNIPYWNCSPYGGEHPNGNEAGDRHHWHDCTMNADMEKRITPEEYDRITAKFISEYGYIGPCCKSSIIKYHGGIPLDKKGGIWQMHNNEFEKNTVPAGIAKHYTDPEKLDIDSYLLYAGLCQGLMYGYSLEAIRFKENCSGSLFWMYNDTWGEVGWTIIDYYLKRKPSYYFVKRAFAPVKFIMREIDGIVRVMGINEKPEVVDINVEYGYASFDGKERKTKNCTINLKPYSRQTVLEFEKGRHDFKKGTCFIKPVNDTESVLPAILRSGVFKELSIPEAVLKVHDFVIDGCNARFRVSSDVYAHAVHFNLDDRILLSDEYFDLLPGETREVVVYGVNDGTSYNNIKAGYVKRV